MIPKIMSNFAFYISLMHYRILYIIICMLAALSATAQQSKVTVDDKGVDSRTVVYDGIDVSSYQKDIDWSTTASDKNIKFVYVKATEGATHRQRHYAYNIKNARKHGIKVGAYHFLRTTTSIRRQFENFISIVKLEDQDLIPLIDVEDKGKWSAKQIADSVLLFAQLLEKHYGCKPMIYTGSSFYNSYLAGRLKGYKLFIARYSKIAPKLNDATWTLWQFSERGRIAGIDAYVDLCRFNRGCTLSDILIPGRSAGRRKSTSSSSNAAPPPPKKKPEAKPKPVPESKQQRKAREKAEHEAKKKAEQEAKHKAEQAKKEAKEREKRAKEKAKQDARLKKEREKHQQDSAKHAQEVQRKRKAEQDKQRKAKEKEQQRLQQEWEEQQAKAAKEKKRAQEKARKREQERKAQQEREKKRQQTAKAKSTKESANQRNKRQGKRVNQSSADND